MTQIHFYDIAETKRGENVSIMKNKIIDESINSLRQKGLRFSIDTLAEKMKISKKTIYTYFSNKEELAYAIYEKYYFELTRKAQAIIRKQSSLAEEQLLLCYFDSAKMVSGEIFNKYSLNQSVGSFALQHHLNVWNLIRPHICDTMSIEESEIYKLIVDGSFDKAISYQRDPIKIIRMLRKIK